MAVFEGAQSVDSAAEKIFDILGNDDAEPAVETPIEQLSDEAKADRIANEAEPEPAEVVAGDDEATETSETTEEPAKAIEPPTSWNADAKERFKALPPELQRYVADRESERDRGLSKTQQEAAEARKAFEANAEAVQQERQALLQRLNSSIGYVETVDPIIAKGRKTDWAQAIRDNPAAMADLVEYQQREAGLKQQVQMRQELQSRMEQDAIRKADEDLKSKLDFWGDKDKRSAFQSELRKYLQDEGYRPEEIAGVSDSRSVITARKAMLYDQMMAQQKTIAAKQVKPSPAKTVLKSQATNDGDKSDKTAAVLKRVKSTSRTDEQAAIIASLLN